MKTIYIQRMREADIPAVQEIERLSFSDPWPPTAYEHELHSEHSLPIVAKADGKVVGFGVLWMVLDEAHIANLAVHPDWRGKGIGKALLAQMLTEAQRMGARRATLEVRVGNYAAQALYRRFGFELVGWRPKYYSNNKEDALIMTLEFPNNSTGSHS